MRPRPPTALLAAPLVAALLAGCGPNGPSADDPAVDGPAVTPPPPDEELCPARLPEPSSGTTPADAVPPLPDAARAWVCGYARKVGGSWELVTPVEAVAPTRLNAVASALDGLAPGADETVCTQEVGPRYLLVLADETSTDVTGVLVDEFGCRHVRVADEPATTPVGGVLGAPPELLAVLRDVVPPVG